MSSLALGRRNKKIALNVATEWVDFVRLEELPGP